MSRSSLNSFVKDAKGLRKLTIKSNIYGYSLQVIMALGRVIISCGHLPIQKGCPMKKIELGVRLLLGGLGLLLIMNGAVLSTIINFNIGLVATIGLGLFCFSWACLWSWLKKTCTKGWKKWIYTLSILCFALYMGCISFLAIYGQKDTVTYSEDALIVLGAGIHGEQVSRVLQFRLDTAVQYHQKNPEVIIVVSGGQGDGETISEALAMKRYLTQKGIPQNQIILEDLSTSTVENFKFSKHLLDQYFKKDYEVAFTTNTFHIFRAQLIAQNTGLEGGYLNAPIDSYMMPVVYIREVMALIKYCLLG